MSDLEHFAASEGQEADPQAVERMRERMRANAAQIKQAKKDEKKQKKKEDDLAHVIVKYLQSQQKRDIMLLVIRCLEQGIPPVFVLAIISLTEDELQEFISTDGEQKQISTSIYEKALSRIGIEEGTVSLKGRIRITSWLEELKKTADEKGTAITNTLKESTGEIKVIAIQLTSFVLRKFLEKHDSNIEFKKLQVFAHFILTGLCNKIEKKTQNLEKGSSEEV